MSFLDVGSGQIVANAAESERAAFIQRTYLHLGGAIVAYAVAVTFFLQTGIANAFMGVLAGSSWMWLLVMAAYMGISMLADNWAHSGVSRERQYMGLGLYVVAFAFLSTLPITRALMTAPDTLTYAVVITAALVGGLTFTAFSTKINFSFMGRFLMIGGFVAMGVIVAAILFGFSLGLWFSGAMILFAAASVLYSTSNIIHEYHTNQHVAASLSLFSSVGLLFWYVLQFLMAFMGDD
ncbi:Bax inhibitor-1/YccA family protein [Leucothrix mucor]|jgi:FtsH-binding integral membrane protein|uniref:Bax inhibitor-1/YccA family protein n=1 Tax=Leucothrix mucor TaxID=45248 RepID=UPI0003B6C628|nr:Bax inhibitor-1 family protein [Leucothrix mucor]